MLIPAAHAGKLFGSDGGLTLTLYPAFPVDFSADTPFFVRIDALDVPLWCACFERRGATGAIVRFEDFDTERRAAELAGKELFLDLREERDDDEFYMEDLIGFRAVCTETGIGVHARSQAALANRGPEDAERNRTLEGRVTDYYDSEANPLLEVTADDGTQVLIPAVEDFIARIDFEGRTIRFVLPEGLVELNAK